MSCNICAEDYNKSTRNCVVCPYCSYDVCRTCCETYILSEPNPRCMNPDCYKEWSRKFLRDNFTLVFLTKRYRPHMEDILFDKEKALLPNAQLVIEDNIRKNVLRQQIRDIESRIQILYEERSELERQINGKESRKERSQFVRQCPSNDCRGFLSTQWKCGICELWTCSDCHEIKGPLKDCDHICKPENVETAKLLEKDSKPCPSCHSMIFKITGCNQMWCTQCNTAFCWATGRINTKQIHNPHYFDWLRNNPNGARNMTANAPNCVNEVNNCGMEINHGTAKQLVQATIKHSNLQVKSNRNPTVNQIYQSHILKNEIDPFIKIIRNIIHLMQVETHNFASFDYVTYNEDLRVLYLEGKITENEFKTEIQRRDKKNRKNTEITQIFNFANTATTDIIYRLLNHLNEVEENKYNLSQFFDECRGLMAHCNDLFKEVSRTYGVVLYQFGEEFQFGRGFNANTMASVMS